MGAAVSFHQIQDASRNQAPHRVACALGAEANATRKPGNRESELELAFETAMAEKMRIDDAVRQRKVELRREQVFHLFPHLCNIEFFVVHSFES
jgi:hypothetical protein